MSVVLKPRDEKFIRGNLPDAEKLLLSDNADDILDALFMWIEIHGLDEDEFPNEKGMEAQEVYDSIYYGYVERPTKNGASFNISGICS